MGNRAVAKRPQVERMIRFPTPLYLRLSDKAKQEQRSIQGQVIAELERNIPADESGKVAA